MTGTSNPNRPAHYDTRFQWELTPRQGLIVRLIAGGQTDAQIADSLGISLDGAKYHVKEILRKRGASSRHAVAA